MNKEVISVLRDTDKVLFLDCTVGMGGHASLILEAFPGSGLIALDMDMESIKMAEANLKKYEKRVKFFRTRFTDVFDLKDIRWGDVSGVLVDPGLSVFQIKSEGRGFSHSESSRLDMRKDRGSAISAYEVINKYNEKQLTEIFEKYGEVRNATAFSKRIIERRLFKPVETAEDLRKIVEDFFGWRPKKGLTHPAARIFQAIRIHVNAELEGIEAFIDGLAGRLARGARIVFLTFHSIEDRIVKAAFRKLRDSGKAGIIRPFPMKPTDEEVLINLPSRSAKLRAVEII